MRLAGLAAIALLAMAASHASSQPAKPCPGDSVPAGNLSRILRESLDGGTLCVSSRSSISALDNAILQWTEAYDSAMVAFGKRPPEAGTPRAPPAIDNDTDEDGLDDGWETRTFGSLEQEGRDDPDQDGLGNALEFAHGSDPLEADSDRDGVPDGGDADPADPTNAKRLAHPCLEAMEPLDCYAAAWYSYVNQSRPGSRQVPLLSAIYGNIDRLQMDAAAYPTWHELAAIRSHVAELDAGVDSAYRSAAATEFASRERALQDARVDLAQGLVLPALLAAGLSTGFIAIWGAAWKRKMAMWVGYNAQFKSLDPARLGGLLAAGILALGLLVALALGLPDLVAVLLR